MTEVYVPSSQFTQSGHVAAGGGVKAINGQDLANSYLVYGPYANTWGEVSGRTQFEISVSDNVGAAQVVTIEIYDATTQEILTQAHLKKSDFSAANVFYAFSLDYGLICRNSHSFETRVFWHGGADVQVRKITSILNKN